MRLGRVVSMTSIVALFAATGAFGDSLGDTSEEIAARQSAAAAKPTLAVVVVGRGRVTSTPAGISCPGKCVGTFATGTRVLLTQAAKKGSRFLRWGGNCSGARSCRVKVSALSAVAAEFVGGSSTAPSPPRTNPVDPGAYSGSGVSFFVQSGAGDVLTFTRPGVGVSCAGGGAFGYPFTILKTAIGGDRSFTGKSTESAVIGGAAATITYVVTGRFEGRDSQGRATAGGIYRIDIAYTDTPSRKCTSNDQSWTATRSLPPSTSPVEPGTYSGSGVSFFVPSGAASVQNFTRPGVGVSCAGGGALGYPFKIPTAAIGRDRSFTAKSSESAVIGGAGATVTYSVTGYFQGRDSAGRATAAGIYRIDIVFTATPSRRCTSNDQSWATTRTG